MPSSRGSAACTATRSSTARACWIARLRLKALPRLRFAGQITGVEGYVESAAIGLLAGRFAAAERSGHGREPPPPTTALGALLAHITGGADAKSFQPMNVNFGLFPPLPEPSGQAPGQGRPQARPLGARPGRSRPLAQDHAGRSPPSSPDPAAQPRPRQRPRRCRRLVCEPPVRRHRTQWSLGMRDAGVPAPPSGRPERRRVAARAARPGPPPSAARPRRRCAARRRQEPAPARSSNRSWTATPASAISACGT